MGGEKIKYNQALFERALSAINMENSFMEFNNERHVVNPLIVLQ